MVVDGMANKSAYANASEFGNSLQLPVLIGSQEDLPSSG